MASPATDPVAAGWGAVLRAGTDEAARARLKAHPAFRQAMADCAGWLVASHQGDRLLNRVLNDRGRLIFGYLVLYLDALPPAAGGGLTANRLVGLCLETGLCSRGRARAMLALLHWGGYLAAAAVEGVQGDRRVKPLQPTERMRALFRERWRTQLAIVAPLDPVAGQALAALDDSRIAQRLILAFGAGFRAGVRVLAATPDLAAVADRDGGAMILFLLLVSRLGGTEPPALAEMARRFHISRAQALTIVRDLEAGGLLVRGAGALTGHLTERGEAALADFFAAVFCQFLTAARIALAAD